MPVSAPLPFPACLSRETGPDAGKSGRDAEGRPATAWPSQGSRQVTPCQGQPEIAGDRPDPTTLAEVGVALTVVRQWRGLTQRALCAKLHCGTSALSRWESAKEGMRLATLLNVLDTLEIAPDHFFRIARALTEHLSAVQLAAKIDQSDPGELAPAFGELHLAIDNLRQLVDRCVARGPVHALLERIVRGK